MLSPACNSYAESIAGRPATAPAMDKYSTTAWGYKIVSHNKINFYHVLLPKIDLASLENAFPQIQKQDDGTIIVKIPKSSNTLTVIEKLVSFFDKKTQDFIDTPKQYYKIEEGIRQTLKSWALAFQGCLALMLLYHPRVKNLIGPKWQFINSQTGGLYLPPYTLFLYKDYPKIIHPVTFHSYESRRQIEEAASLFVRRAVKRIYDAQPGFFGTALLSLVEETSGLPAKEITKIINDKSFGIQNPAHSPFFS